MSEIIGDKQVFSLAEVMRSIQKTITERYGSSFWVKAEMNKLNYYKHSGHCYPDLVVGPVRGVLDVDEHRAVVRGERQAGHFAATGTDEEAPQFPLGLHVERHLSALRIHQVARDHRQHLIVGVVGEGLFTVVGLDPQHAATVERQPGRHGVRQSRRAVDPDRQR